MRPLRPKEGLWSETNRVASICDNAPPYRNFGEFTKKLAQVKLKGWTREVNEKTVKLNYSIPNAMIPKYTVIIEDSLEYQCFVFGWRIPKEHEIFTSHSLNEITISVLLDIFLSYKLCPGLQGMSDAA